MASQIFSVANLLALVGWVLLAVFPHRRWPVEASSTELGGLGRLLGGGAWLEMTARANVARQGARSA
jgi:hypothetical protein